MKTSLTNSIKSSIEKLFEELECCGGLDIKAVEKHLEHGPEIYSKEEIFLAILLHMGVLKEESSYSYTWYSQVLFKPEEEEPSNE